MPKVNKQSIRLLTRTLVEAAIDKNKENFTLADAYLPRSIKVIKALADGEDEQKNFQLESLIAIQLLINELEHPSGNEFNVNIFSCAFWFAHQTENNITFELIFHSLSLHSQYKTGFLIAIFNELYEGDDFYDVNVFKAWSTSTEEPLGKGTVFLSSTPKINCRKIKLTKMLLFLHSFRCGREKFEQFLHIPRGE